MLDLSRDPGERTRVLEPQLVREGIPAAAAKLTVIGAPYFNDHADRGTCTKRCPECGTTYAWVKDYELEVAAMVDTIDISLTRLDDVAGVVAVERALAEVAHRKQQFQLDGARWVSVALQSNDRVEAERAVSELIYHQSMFGEDLAFAVPALVRAIVHHAHTSGLIAGTKVRRCDFGRTVSGALEKVAGSGAAQRALVLESLNRLAPKERRPEIKDLRLLLAP